MSDVSIPGYDDFRLLGRGGFSAVYSARQVDYDRRVAVKVLDIGINDDALRRRLQRERAATGRLTGHPNIVTILDSGFLADRRPFLTMALCPQGSLADRVAREGPLPLADVLHVGVTIAGALETAHRVDIVHRDIKPENILITAIGEPALADFGIATITDHRSMTRNTQAYTPNHAPPEVLRGEPAGVASDVYNLGSTLYQLLAGHPPFAMSGSAGLAVFVDKVLNSEAPPPRDDLPESLLGVLRRAMAKAATDRYASAAEFGEALRDTQRELGLRVDDLPVLVTAPDVPQPPPAPQATVLPSTGGGTRFPDASPNAAQRPGPPQAGSAGPDATVLPPAPSMAFAAAPGAGAATRLGNPPPAPPAPPSVPAPAAPPPKKRRGLLVAAIIGVLVALLGTGGYAAMTLAGERDDKTTSRVTPPATPSGATEPAPGASPDGGTGPAPGASSAAPNAPASAPQPGSTSPKPAGPAMTSIVVKNITCATSSPGGPWEGQFDVSWKATRADNVQLYGPTSSAFLGGFEGASGEATFAFPCTPNGSFLLRAVPRSQSAPGPYKDYKGRWPDSARVTNFTVSKLTCDGSAPNLELRWSSRGADEVHVFYNGDMAASLVGLSGAANGSGVAYGDCTAGSSYFLRAVAYKNGVPGGSRDVHVKW
ncbi:serine/threonine-protein kinase [Micromonospora eburnea]|uniref:non-specific serine/threonine protein kinase n=1 Tax=Micromonospora eburnea TaxID=227316 RepID=A0A1C6VB28_9ACTN|nr:serine/threonine-protein kinase [Micromonospora eburnea]SCL63080.1 Serine/threonine protein kinase [Micromonospora eburnea]